MPFCGIAISPNNSEAVVDSQRAAGPTGEVCLRVVTGMEPRPETEFSSEVKRNEAN